VGHYLSREALREGLRPVEQIRQAVGDQMEIAIEATYARLTSAARVKICASERLFTRFGFRHLIEREAAHIIMPDIVWTGGLTEARKIAALADTHYLPITTHDTVGPVALWTAAHSHRQPRPGHPGLRPHRTAHGREGARLRARGAHAAPAMGPRE
jgi:L-alanine-DL-glutamate epimerase-like enolase superfamily enzyme